MKATNTVLNKTTKTSARMSPNIHATAATASKSSQFRTADFGKISSTSSSRTVQYQIKNQTKGILMESSVNIKALFTTNNDRYQKLSARDERLLQILTSQPDEPLFLDDADNEFDNNGHHLKQNQKCFAECSNQRRSDKDNNVDDKDDDNYREHYRAATSSTNAMNLLHYPATSSIANGDVRAADDYENLPPPNELVVTNVEGENLTRMAVTPPPKHFNDATWNRIKRDLNSPSASCRVRAIRALKSPSGGNYFNFDVPHEEEELVTEADRISAKPKTIEEVMKDVIVYVEVRTTFDNRTDGVKSIISKLGAKVNDKLLRNTTHVVFKDGLQSTYNKAKNWNIPIVSVLWIEACKSHLIVMDPKAYPISNIEQYENPELYQKMKRHKSMQPGAEEKNFNRKIPKSKLLGYLKKQTENESASLTLSTTTMPPSTDAIQSDAENVSASQRLALSNKKLLVKEKMATKNISSRKSINKTAEKPKITIRSMFLKQMEQSQLAVSQPLPSTPANAFGTLKTNTIPTPVKTFVDVASTLVDSNKAEIAKSNAASTDFQLVPGKLHTRLTRRNSMTFATPTKTTKTNDESNAEIENSTAFVNLDLPATPNANITTRHRTMFTPAVSQTIIFEEGDAIENGSISNQTVNDTRLMDVCNETTTIISDKYNNKTRQAINEILLKTPSKTAQKMPDGHDQQRSISAKKASVSKSVLRRQTLYTPRPMDETNVQGGPVTPISLKRRKTLNFNVIEPSPRPLTNLLEADLDDTRSCDATLPPIKSKSSSVTLDLNKPISMSTLKAPFDSLASTPLTKNMLQIHQNLIRKSTSKSLLDEYTNTFSSKKMPMSDKRRTIANITMDIIKQRVENMNKNASLNRSVNNLNERDGVESKTPISSEPKTIESTDVNITPANEADRTSKPMKRKLFAPPSMFSPLASTIATPKTEKKTVLKTTTTQKRNRSEMLKDIGVKKVNKPAAGRATSSSAVTTIKKKTTSNLRRSTLLFQEPSHSKSASIRKKAASTCSTAAVTSSALNSTNGIAAEPPIMVLTNMHQPQIDFIHEAVKILGKFQLEESVSAATTHLITLEPRRTINMLRGIIRGVWILEYDWIVKSMEAKEWQPEPPYELKCFSKAVEISRMERQAFGKHYKMDIFATYGPFYISSRCVCKNLRELVILCGGKVIKKNASKAQYIIDECHRKDSDNNVIQPNWILDSISAGIVQKIDKYQLNFFKSNKLFK